MKNIINKSLEYIDSFYSGMMIGIDPIGTYKGQKNNDYSFMGYSADQKGMPAGMIPSIHFNDDKKERNLDEIIFKLTGVVCGLSSNLFLFLPQMIFYQSAKDERENIKNLLLSRKDTEFETSKDKNTLDYYKKTYNI